MRSKKAGPFDFVNLNYIRSKVESKALNHDRRPMIIIAGSGMCEAGRVLHHLRNSISDSRNTVLIVGYMAANTLGRRIVNKERFVKIYGIEHELNANVAVINAFSGHADKNELHEYTKSCLPIEKVFIVHGDPEQSKSIFDLMLQSGINAYMPDKNEEVVLKK